MLDKILNINPQEKYKSGLKIQPTQFYNVHRQDRDKENSKDSALFSPQAKLLSKINWKILNIEYPNNDEMLFNFLVDDFEFISVINFNELYSKIYHEFTIFLLSNKLQKKWKFETKLKVLKGEISIIDKPDPILTEGIQVLFDRIIDLEINSLSQITDENLLTGLTSGISYALMAEFNYMLKVIYTFISTRHRGRIKNHFILKTEKNIPIIMQKIGINIAE